MEMPSLSAATTALLFIIAFTLIYVIARFILVRFTASALNARGFDQTVIGLGKRIAGAIALFGALALPADPRLHELQDTRCVCSRGSITCQKRSPAVRTAPGTGTGSSNSKSSLGWSDFMKSKRAEPGESSDANPSDGSESVRLNLILTTSSSISSSDESTQATVY